MTTSKMIAGGVLLTIGFGLAYAGLGFAGVLTELNADVGGLFAEQTPDKVAGFAAVAAGLLSAFLAIAIAGPYGRERNYARPVNDNYNDLDEEEERERED